jgi:hypothetical protein
MASIYRAVGLPLPEQMPTAGETALRKFQSLLAQYMPFTMVIDERTADGDEARVSKTSVCGSWGPITGQIRYFADKFGNPRASIEGTQIPYDLLRPFATVREGELVYNPDSKRAPLVLRRRVDYHGFELEREIEPIEAFSPDIAPRARRVLAEALARGEARHPGARKNQDAIESIRETYRRSGGKTPRFGFSDLASHYEAQLGDVGSMTAFRHAPVYVDADAIVPRETREQYAHLPTTTNVRGKEVEIQYDVEDGTEGPIGIARLRLPEKLARTLVEEELPALDRPLRFVVTRGARGAARAATLDVLQEELERPFTEQEIADLERSHEHRRRDRHERHRERNVRDAGGDLKDHRRGQGGDDRPRGGGGRGPKKGKRFRPPGGGKRKRGR